MWFGRNTSRNKNRTREWKWNYNRIEHRTQLNEIVQVICCSYHMISSISVFTSSAPLRATLIWFDSFFLLQIFGFHHHRYYYRKFVNYTLPQILSYDVWYDRNRKIYIFWIFGLMQNVNIYYYVEMCVCLCVLYYIGHDPENRTMLTTTGDRRRTEHKTKYELELFWCFSSWKCSCSICEPIYHFRAAG